MIKIEINGKSFGSLLTDVLESADQAMQKAELWHEQRKVANAMDTLADVQSKQIMRKLADRPELRQQIIKQLDQ